ncbi:hypothetical protein E3U43_005966 [Larimichthys crocea]|uniref:Uncharacterized protein n=1 Tax=Larimichthys crocea TaxID=215358 RepID=A0ACD3QPP5_LARCR|nr:hypothetical protein E3U43_005966 [Larimichthys crocea]
MANKVQSALCIALICLLLSSLWGNLRTLPVCTSISLFICKSVFLSASLSVTARRRAPRADGCRPMSQTEATFTLLESNTDLNQLKHNHGGEIAPDIYEKGKKKSFYPARTINPFDRKR